MIFIVDLFFRIVTRLGDIARRDEYAERQIALLTAAAIRLNAQVGTKNGRHILSREGIAVEVTFAQSDGMMQSLIWRTTVPPPGLPNFEMARNGRIVAAADKDVMALLLTPERRERLTRDLINLEIWCENNRLTIRLKPAILYQNVTDGAFELMFGLVATDPYATKVLRSLGDYHEAALPHVVLDVAAEVELGYARIDGRLVTEARIGVREILPTAEAALRELGATAVAVRDGRLAITWSEVVRDRDRLLQIAEILRGIASPSDGVFR